MLCRLDNSQRLGSNLLCISCLSPTILEWDLAVENYLVLVTCNCIREIVKRHWRRVSSAVDSIEWCGKEPYDSLGNILVRKVLYNTSKVPDSRGIESFDVKYIIKELNYCGLKTLCAHQAPKRDVLNFFVSQIAIRRPKDVGVNTYSH